MTDKTRKESWYAGFPPCRDTPFPEETDPISELLLAWVAYVHPGDTNKWNELFSSLGLDYPGIRRFDLVLGIYRALASVDPWNWIHIWLRSLPAAGIHPLSLSLCQRQCDHSRLLNVMEDAIYQMNQIHSWYKELDEPRRYNNSYGSYTSYITLYPEARLDNLISSHPISIYSTETHGRLEIGHGWNVHCLEVHPERRGCQVVIGEDLVISSDLDLRDCRGKITFCGDPKIGGRKYLTDQKGNMHATPESCFSSRGIRFRGKDYDYYFKGHHPSETRLEDPLEIPESLGILMAHMDGYDWMSP